MEWTNEMEAQARELVSKQASNPVPAARQGMFSFFFSSHSMNFNFVYIQMSLSVRPDTTGMRSTLSTRTSLFLP